MINVKYVSSSRSPSGYGEAARQFIVALFSAGVNLTTENLMQMPETTDYGITGAICNSLENRDIAYKVSIIHLTPDLYPNYMEKGVYHIGHLFWETDRLPREWIEPCNKMDELWVASSQMAEMVKNSGVTTLCTPFPQPIDIGKAEEKIIPFSLQFPKDFIFYTIGQWIDRKNFRGLLRAYWKAFEGNDKVSLLLKTYRVNYSENEYKLLRADINKWKNELKLTHYPKVLLVKNLLTENQVAKLHALGDCYVNASSGEGWGRPLQEAMLYSNPVISANNGGITDVMTDAYYFSVPSSLQNATEQSHIPWYTTQMKWKAIDEILLSKQMKFVYNNYDKALERGKKAQQFVIENFSFRRIGDQMRNRLGQIYAVL